MADFGRSHTRNMLLWSFRGPSCNCEQPPVNHLTELERQTRSKEWGFTANPKGKKRQARNGVSPPTPKAQQEQARNGVSPPTPKAQQEKPGVGFHHQPQRHESLVTLVRKNPPKQPRRWPHNETYRKLTWISLQKNSISVALARSTFKTWNHENTPSVLHRTQHCSIFEKHGQHFPLFREERELEESHFTPKRSLRRFGSISSCLYKDFRRVILQPPIFVEKTGSISPVLNWFRRLKVSAQHSLR